MQLKPPTFTVALLGLLFTFPTTVDADDSLQLVRGDLFTGAILRVTDREVSIRLNSGGIVAFQIQNVKKIRRWHPGRSSPEVIVFDHTPKSDVNGEDNTINALTKKVEAPDSWSLEPPRGFKIAKNQKATKAGAPIVLRTWVDPTVTAKVVLSISATATSDVETLKMAALNPLTETKGFRVIRDQAVQRGGKGGYSGWILEVEHSLGNTPSRQLAMFASWNERVFQLTFSCRTQDYPAIARLFEQSMESFRILAPDDKHRSRKSEQSSLDRLSD